MRKFKPNAHIGIIGGAGPLAGSLLFEKIIEVCQRKYHCKQDADFPFISLLNRPFADMLKEEETEHLRQQLTDCFHECVLLKANVVVIACNTLHAFLPPVPKEIRLIHLIQETVSIIQGNPIVLGTSTSARHQLHSPFSYPATDLQQKLNQIIHQILAGASLSKLSSELSRLLNEQSSKQFLLGCTEFSLLNEKEPLLSRGLNQGVTLWDPYSMIAEKLCDLIEI